MYLNPSPATWSRTIHSIQQHKDVTMKQVHNDLGCLVVHVPSEKSVDIVNELRRMPGVTGIESNKGGHEKFL